MRDAACIVRLARSRTTPHPRLARDPSIRRARGAPALALLNGATTGWHHHGDYATYGYITEGRMTVEFGPAGTEALEVTGGAGGHRCS